MTWCAAPRQWWQRAGPGGHKTVGPTLTTALPGMGGSVGGPPDGRPGLDLVSGKEQREGRG